MNTEKIEALKFAIDSDLTTLENCLLLLYSKQTAGEQEAGQTAEKNNYGFSGCDSKTLSYYARWLESGRHLSDRFLIDARKRIKKYVGQLIKIQEEEILKI